MVEEEGELLVHTHVAEVPERIWPGAHGGKYLKAFAEHLKKAGYDFADETRELLRIKHYGSQ